MGAITGMLNSERKEIGKTGTHFNYFVVCLSIISLPPLFMSNMFTQRLFVNQMKFYSVLRHS